jgi:hypothetical protein
VPKKKEPKEQGWGNPRPFDSKSKFHYFGQGGASFEESQRLAKLYDEEADAAQ